jgi:D-glycero-D-manno-heptose 1,7-bisphosphate phosphatase
MISWILLDRDGTINAKAPDGGYITRPEDLILLPGAAGAIASLNKLELPVAVVTNQRGVALKRLTESTLSQIHERMYSLLAEEGAHIDTLVYCPHHLDECACRKPMPGLLFEAAKRLKMDPMHAVMVGDSENDIIAGQAAGCRTIRLATNPSTTTADSTTISLQDAITQIIDWRVRESQD